MKNIVRHATCSPKGLWLLFALLFVCALATAAFAVRQQQANQQPQQPRPAITQASPEEAARELNNPRSKWFREAKFGLFIHWGVYSVLGDGEWVMRVKNIPYNNYKRLADFFNPHSSMQKSGCN